MRADPCWVCGDSELVSVHGHVQCATCGRVTEPCCGGAPTSDPVNYTARPDDRFNVKTD